MLQHKLNTVYACWRQHTIRPLVLRMIQGTASITSAWNLHTKCYCQHYTDLPHAIHKASYLETMVILISIIWGYRTSVNESSPATSHQLQLTIEAISTTEIIHY